MTAVWAWLAGSRLGRWATIGLAAVVAAALFLRAYRRSIRKEVTDEMHRNDMETALSVLRGGSDARRRPVRPDEIVYRD